MNVTVSRDHLLNGLRLACDVVSARTTMPVLSTVLLETREGLLHLCATDTEMTIRTALPAIVTEEGSTTMPAKKIQQIVALMPAGDVNLASDEGQATKVTCGKARFRIVGLDPQGFPRDTEFAEEWSFSMPGVELGKALAKVSYARSEDDSRQTLNGVLLSVRQGMLTVAATDGRRLALMEKHLPGEGVQDGDVILPPKLVAELQHMLDGEGDVRVRLTASRASFEFGSTLVVSRLVEGSYPNYRQVVPPTFEHSVAIPRVAFSEAVNRVAMVVSDTSGAVKVSLKPAELTVSAVSMEVGEASEPVDVSYEGSPMTMSLNPAFLIEPLKHLECDQLILRLNDEYSPIAVSGDEGYLYIVMPMRN